MPLKPLILLLFLCLFYSNAQEITIIDYMSKNPIDNVLIFNKSGKYLGKTDLDGKFEKNQIENLTDFVILHSAIKTDTITLSNIVNDEIAVKQIREQPVTKIHKNNSNKEFIIIKGFFTIYNTTDGVLTNYTDGIVQYIIDKKTNEYKNYVIQEYRNFSYKDRYLQENAPLITFSGITQFPVLDNIEAIKKSKDFGKNLKTSQNQLVIRKSNDSIKNEYNSKFLGYLYSNIKFDLIYKFSGDNADFFELSNFYKCVKLDVKQKKQNNFTTFSSIANFYPLEIKYLDKNEIGKGVTLNDNKSKYTSNYWQDNYFSYLIDYLSQKSLYEIRFMKNQK